MRTTWLAVAIVMVSACSKTPTYKSNFATVKLDNGSIVTADSNKPFAGTLIARDGEIQAVAKAVLTGSTLESVTETDTTGLVLVMRVEAGRPSGRAQILVDLNAPKLNPEVARRNADALELARAVSPTVKIADATFKAGKLDGVATVFEPDPKNGRIVKSAEVQLVDNVPHGRAVEYFAGTTQVARELTFDRGVQVGLQKQFHRNGTVEREATYVADKPHGEVKEHYANGAKRALQRYENGTPVGTHTHWYPNGKIEREIEYGAEGPIRRVEYYSNGASKEEPANGVIEEFHANGAVHTRATYANGAMHGAFEMFYSDGTKHKLGQFANGQPHGRAQAWWKNGKPALDGTYENGTLVGDYKRWYANGKEWETATYVAGKRVGAYRKYWKNGKPAHVYSYTIDGKLDGEYKQLYDTGAKWVVATYAAGKPQGAVQRWFPNGTLGYVMNHTNGRPDGSYKRWYADGKPRLEATYVNGQLDGELKNWLEDGAIYETATYHRGAKVATSRKPS